MKDIAATIIQTVSDSAMQMAVMDDRMFSERKAPGKWSKKEVLGHLVDSAQNNIQRFIRGQYESNPPRITYEQDEWVGLGNYQSYAKEELIQFWVLLNVHLSHVLKSMDPANYEKTCLTGQGDAQTLLFFAVDYLQHMRHHLSQINHH